jgi:hypothetical protein
MPVGAPERWVPPGLFGRNPGAAGPGTIAEMRWGVWFFDCEMAAQSLLRGTGGSAAADRGTSTRRHRATPSSLPMPVEVCLFEVVRKLARILNLTSGKRR